MLVREAKLSDVPGLNKLLNFIAGEEIHLSVNKTKTLKERKIWFKKYLEKRKENRKIMFVCLENNQIIGSGSATRKQGKRNHVWEIGYQVKKEHREKGIGSTLLSELLKNLKIKSAEQIVTWVLETNNNSTNLLKKFGFEETGRIKRGVKINRDYCDYLLFQRSL